MKKYLLIYLDDAFGKANKGDSGQGGFDQQFGLEREIYQESKLQVIAKDREIFNLNCSESLPWEEEAGSDRSPAQCAVG